MSYVNWHGAGGGLLGPQARQALSDPNSVLWERRRWWWPPHGASLSEARRASQPRQAAQKTHSSRTTCQGRLTRHLLGLQEGLGV